MSPQDFYNMLIAASACIVTVSGAIGVIIKWVSAAKKPNEDQNRRLDEHERILAKHTELLDNDNKKLREMSDGNKVTQRALLALLSHGIDGNDLESMRKAKKEIQDYLINKN